MMKRITLAILLMLAAPLGTASVVSCVSSEEPAKKKKKSSAKISDFVVAAAPKDMIKLDVNLGDKVTLLGYTINRKGSAKPGQKISYKLYWRVDQAIGEKGWRVFTHILNTKNKKLLNIDNVGPLRNNGKARGQAFPPSDWEIGKIYVDKQSFKVPRKANGGLLKIVTGIWKGKQRLETKSGPHIDKNRALVTTLRVGKPKAPNTRVPTLRVDKLSKQSWIRIDGKLNEPAWASAPTTGNFVNVRSGKPDSASKVQGSAKVLWNDKALYLAFEVKDEDVTGGFKKTEKDPHLWTKDCVEIMVDPDGDGDNRDYYEIQVNPQNLVFDSQFDSYNKPKGGAEGPFGHQKWSAKLKSAVKVDGTLDKPGDKDGGYTVEVQIPWSSFSKAKTTPPKVGSNWRMNFYAMQNNGGVAWSPILGQGNFHKASRFGRIQFAEKGWVDPKQDPKATKTDTASLKSGKKGAPPPAKAAKAPPAATPKKAAPVPAKPKATPAAPKAITPVAPPPAKPVAPTPATGQ